MVLVSSPLLCITLDNEWPLSEELKLSVKYMLPSVIQLRQCMT